MKSSSVFKRDSSKVYFELFKLFWTMKAMFGNDKNTLTSTASCSSLPALVGGSDRGKIVLHVATTEKEFYCFNFSLHSTCTCREMIHHVN